MKIAAFLPELLRHLIRKPATVDYPFKKLEGPQGFPGDALPPSRAVHRLPRLREGLPGRGHRDHGRERRREDASRWSSTTTGASTAPSAWTPARRPRRRPWTWTPRSRSRTSTGTTSRPSGSTSGPSRSPRLRRPRRAGRPEDRSPGLRARDRLRRSTWTFVPIPRGPSPALPSDPDEAAPFSAWNEVPPLRFEQFIALPSGISLTRDGATDASKMHDMP